MKKNIHPAYYPNAKVTCSCGTAFEVGSTEPKIKVEICSACHPLYTGQKKFVDTAGRLDKFRAREEKTKKLQDDLQTAKAKTKKSSSKEE